MTTAQYDYSNTLLADFLSDYHLVDMAKLPASVYDLMQSHYGIDLGYKEYSWQTGTWHFWDCVVIRRVGGTEFRIWVMVWYADEWHHCEVRPGFVAATLIGINKDVAEKKAQWQSHKQDN